MSYEEEEGREPLEPPLRRVERHPVRWARVLSFVLLAAILAVLAVIIF
jgi:hypothetical protein